ncbi:acyltransferase domain-containing protein [Streptomyces sp. NPDC006309]|uniref:acyltransferase domain-containing protein n=1 Tax=Streptomyces sp. NPDC006309 TaxID=3156749 RepID=UPI0033BD5334
MVTTGAFRPRPVALLFAGQGAQHPGMGLHLYGVEPHFTDAMDEVFALLGPGGPDLRDGWLARRTDGFDDAGRAQPLLFALGYALARLLLGRGVRPAALLGHSVGEAVAAVVADVVSLPDAMRLLVARTAAARTTPPGGMLAVAASPGTLAGLLPEGVAVAAVNGPNQILLAGAREPLAEAESRLRARGVPCRPARARQGFHSPLMEPAVAATLPEYERTRWRAPAVRLYSAATGGPLTAGEATDPRFWGRQLAAPVLFGPALHRMLTDDDFLLVDAGPGQSLLSLARRHPAVASGRSRAVSLLPAAHATPGPAGRALADAVERIRAEGHTPPVQ